MGKGSNRRPSAVSDKEFATSFDRIFGRLKQWPDGQLREEEPYRCGCFIAPTGQQCTLLSDHFGAHVFDE